MQYQIEVLYEDKKAKTENIVADNLKHVKRKLKNALCFEKFCGICLEVSEDLSHVSKEMEIVVENWTEHKFLSGVVTSVFNNEVNEVLASSYVCNICEHKLLESYMFIANAKLVSRVINTYFNDLLSEAIDIDNHVDLATCTDRPNVVMVLGSHDDVLIPIVKPVNDKTPPKVKEENRDISIVRKDSDITTNTRPRRYLNNKCLKCNRMFPSLEHLLRHRSKKHKIKTPQCKICHKTFKLQQHLSMHYKSHCKVKCKICHFFVTEGELLEHLKLNHEDNAHKCLKCKLVFYSEQALEKHVKFTHEEKAEGLTQCIMCLKAFNEEELLNHKCKYNCPECTEIPCIHYKYLVSYREQLLNHATKIKCCECNYICRRKMNLLGHANREHLDHHPYTCDSCSQQFYSKAMIRAHIVGFHMETKYCQYCDKPFRNSVACDEHTKICETIQREYPCDECLASFDTVDEVEKHKKSKHPEECYPCNYCNKKFLTEGKIKEHLSKVHSGIQLKYRIPLNECAICERKFDTKGELFQHTRTHGPNVKYPCRKCNVQFETIRRLQIHNRKHMAEESGRTNCPICEKDIPVLLLQKHMNYHTDLSGKSSNFSCEACGKSFYYESTLKLHMMSHMDPVPCPKCTKMIKPSNMRRHLRHSHPAMGQKMRPNKNMKFLKCHICDYMTTNKAQLETHINKSHLKVKPFKCSTCTKTFCGKQQLYQHMNTHTEKNCVCVVCGKKYANKVCLKLHFRVHTGEANYSCDMCNEKFRTSSMMKTHKVIKHMEKTIGCPMCGTLYHTVRHMRQHFKKVHWKDKDKKLDPREVAGLGKEFYHLFEDGRRSKVNDDWEFS